MPKDKKSNGQKLLEWVFGSEETFQLGRFPTGVDVLSVWLYHFSDLQEPPKGSAAKKQLFSTISEDLLKHWQSLEAQDNLMTLEVVLDKLKKLVEKSDKLRKSASYKGNEAWKSQKLQEYGDVFDIRRRREQSTNENDEAMDLNQVLRAKFENAHWAELVKNSPIFSYFIFWLEMSFTTN